MITLHITQNKTLFFATEEEAKRFADTMEAKTGNRPAMRKTREENHVKNIVYYGKTAPDYSGKAEA